MATSVCCWNLNSFLGIQFSSGIQTFKGSTSRGSVGKIEAEAADRWTDTDPGLGGDKAGGCDHILQARPQTLISPSLSHVRKSQVHDIDHQVIFRSRAWRRRITWQLIKDADVQIWTSADCRWTHVADRIQKTTVQHLNSEWWRFLHWGTSPSWLD